MNKDVLVLTDANWKQEVSEAAGPVLVDFWAEWCPPCRMIAPAIDALATAYAGRAKVGKLNVDENPKLAVQYDVMTIPRILFFKGSDTPVHTESGVLSPEDLSKLITKYA